MTELFRWMGMVGAACMPLWNIPLILHIIKKKSSQDISLSWMYGIWGCILFMFPSTLLTDDLVLKIFGATNLLFFSGVVVTVIIYRKKP